MVDTARSYSTEDRAVFNIAQEADSERTQNITMGVNIAKDALPGLKEKTRVKKKKKAFICTMLVHCVLIFKRLMDGQTAATFLLALWVYQE